MLPVEQNVFRLQVHVARNHIRIETRVSGANFFILGEDFLNFLLWEKICLAEPPDEKIVRRDPIEHFRKGL